MEEDIQNHSPPVMFRGTPCILLTYRRHFEIKDILIVIRNHGVCKRYLKNVINNVHVQYNAL